MKTFISEAIPGVAHFEAYFHIAQAQIDIFRTILDTTLFWVNSLSKQVDSIIANYVALN